MSDGDTNILECILGLAEVICSNMVGCTLRSLFCLAASTDYEESEPHHAQAMLAYSR